MTTLPESLRYNPYFAGLEGKDAEESSSLEDRIDRLPATVRSFLFDEDLPETLRAAALRCGLAKIVKIGCPNKF